MRDNEAVSTPTNTALNFIVQPLGTQIKPQGVTKNKNKKNKTTKCLPKQSIEIEIFCLN